MTYLSGHSSTTCFTHYFTHPDKFVDAILVPWPVEVLLVPTARVILKTQQQFEATFIEFYFLKSFTTANSDQFSPPWQIHRLPCHYELILQGKLCGILAALQENS